MLDCIFQLLNQWQTLITGILALLAAIPTIFYLRKQIILSESHEEKRRETAEAAARAVLPLTLSAIIDYTQQSSNTLLALYQNREDEVIRESARTIGIPPVPESAIGSLQSMIGASRNPEIATVISKLIQKIQIQNSRMRSVIYPENPTHNHQINILFARNVEEYAIDSAIIHALASSLFTYARSESETTETISWSNVLQSLRLLQWSEYSYPDLYNALESLTNKSPLVE